MRCPDCGKFVSFSDELRTDDVHVDVNDNEITMSGEVYRSCAECDTNLKTANVDVSINLEDHFDDLPDDLGDDVEVEYELDGDPDIEATERSETKDRNGRPITKPRYMRTYYGVETIATVKRTVKRAGVELPEHAATADVTLEWEEAASSFEECF